MQVFYKEDMSKDDQEIPEKWTVAAKKSHDVLVKELKQRGF